MSSKRIGMQTINLPSKPYLIGGSSIVGKKEGEGPLGDHFDKVILDEMNGQESFELAEKSFYLEAVETCLQKAGVPAESVQFLLGGDLLNQIISASFAARDLAVPFVGLYGACSTMSESLCLGSMLVDGGHAGKVLCAASSHFCTAERQYRFPLEFGSQRTPTAQWTVTGAGATLLSSAPGKNPLARAAQVCMGRVIDLGIKDANNMGAAMAPAAADTLCALFRDTRTTPKDYDLILTGDLAMVGHDLLMELMEEHGYPLEDHRYTDCGLEIFDREAQDMHAGGSGCGCSATVFNGHFLPLLAQGKYQKIIFMATGALMSPTSSQQGESIPCIAHAIVLERPKEA
ncbi:MAG: stage V sporulation protein AD [Candidatus Limiplasma sp.]|nr:stage V sporulation protein AD [Candidatus Limiplasma sp.]